MCWNAKVSLNTFLFSLFGTLFAYFYNVIGKFETLYYVSVISMQLIEYFTWKNLNNHKINKFYFTKIRFCWRHYILLK